MIRIGKKQFFRNTVTTITNVGTMEFDGNCVILGNTTIHVLGENSIIHIGKEVLIGEKSQILVGPRIDIGDYSRTAFGGLIMSADFHSVINITTGKVSQNLAPIKIGKYNWLGNNVTVKKGRITPDYCIISNGSLTKDYSDEPLYTLIACASGQVKGYGFRGVYNDEYSAEQDTLFEPRKSNRTHIPLNSSDLSYKWFCNDNIHVISH